jgi:glyoxylase-like metal-dependent hydrolase (beta-lactamase superfamily II)
MKVGSLTVTPVYDGHARLAPEQLYSMGASHFPVLDGARGLVAEEWAPYQRLLTDGRLELSFGGFLISGVPGRLVLVDLGQGPTGWAPEPEFAPTEYGLLLNSLSQLGVTRADITDILFTHLHFDHIGWASVEGKPVFPNATYRCHAAELAHSSASDPVAFGRFEPVLDRIQTWDTDTTIAPGIDVRPAPGHTPGTSFVVVSSDGERLMLVGDVLHCPAELLDDAWAGLGDVDPGRARQVRVSLVRELEQDAIPFAPAHFPGLSFGWIRTGDDGRRQFAYLS